MYGVFLALLSTSLIPKQVRNSLLQSIGIFVVYNLVYGMKSGVDNAAHIGGLVSGLVVGYVYYPGLRAKGKKSIVIAGLIAILTIAATAFYLQNKKGSEGERSRTEKEIEEYKFKDADKYNEQLNKFADAEEKALAPFNETSPLTDQELAEKLQRVSLPEWEKANEAIEKMKNYNVSDKAKLKAEKLQQYIELRKEEISLRSQLAQKDDEETKTKINVVNEKISQLFEELKKL
jgi:rhomboid protease GluP